MLLFFLPLAVGVSGSGSFRAGAVCDGLDMKSTNAVDMLRGKHLFLRECDWAPFATPDDTSPHGWSGLCPDLIVPISEMLGFTYEIGDMGYPLEGEDWTGLLQRQVNEADLFMSFWVPTVERYNSAGMLYGYVDTAVVLVARNAPPPERGVSFTSFLDPFTWQLWCVLILIIFFSGVVDWAVERRTDEDASLSGSIYGAATSVYSPPSQCFFMSSLVSLPTDCMHAQTGRRRILRGLLVWRFRPPPVESIGHLPAHAWLHHDHHCNVT